MPFLNRKIPILALGLCCALSSLVASAEALLSVSVTPNRSRNGEIVLFKVKAQTDSSGRVAAPDVSKLKDWELINSFRSESPSVIYVNGQVQYRYRAEYSYSLKPRKSGALQIPSMNVEIAGKTYKTETLTVQVDPIVKAPNFPSQTARQNQHRQLPPQFQQGLQVPQSDPTDDELNGGNANNGLAPDEVPANQSFFLKPEYKVKEAYVGQMIELSYVLYQRSRNLRNFEMAKFPDFKGFLKEELFITKNFAQERVQVGNEILYRSEIIRYALFPLKSGALKIDPFVVRAEVFTSPEDLINSLITGSPTPQMGNPIPMEKSSGVVTIPVKELPPTPPGVIFTGAVGNFDIDLKGPSGKLTVDQPFTVQFTIAGTGNVKMIEEAALPLPPELELFQTKNTAELRPDTTGYKSFEYLLLPRKNGTLALEPFKWAFFNPQTKNYEVRETPRLSFTIEGSSTANKASDVAAKAPERRVSPFDGIAQPLLKISTSKTTQARLWILIWGSLGALYLALGFAFAKRRKEDLMRARLKDNPWQKTALAITTKDYKNPVDLTILVDQWTREYLTGHLKVKELHHESSRAEFERVILRRLPVEFQPLADELRLFWSQLDLARFAGSEKWPIELKPAQLFPVAQELCKRLVSRCRFDDESAEQDDED
ncbi:MAG: BatD family protein [Bdellovibrionota bacterium]